MFTDDTYTEEDIPTGQPSDNVNQELSEEQVKQLNIHEEYHAKMVEYVNDVKVNNGSTSLPPPKKPAFSFKSILANKDTRKPTRSVNYMCDEDFDAHMKSLLPENESVSTKTFAAMPTKDLAAMGHYLENKYQSIKGKESETFKETLDLGRDLTIARKRFKQIKK